jgi:uncharacterized protein (TIGR03067 family)
MNRYSGFPRFLVFASTLAFAGTGGSLHAQEAPPYHFRNFTLPATDSQLNEKMQELTGEGWEPVTSFAPQAAIFKRIRQSNDKMLDKKWLDRIQGKWTLDTLSENGTQTWPMPQEADAKPTTMTLTFKGQQFEISEGATLRQKGTVPFLIGSTKDNAKLDLVIDQDTKAANKGLTIRLLIKVDQKKLSMCSNGYSSDRPADVPASLDGAAKTPAFSVWTQP